MLNWIELGEMVIIGPNLIVEAKAMVYRIQDNPKDAKSRQESNTRKRH
jgi:hypothetical protein